MTATCRDVERKRRWQGRLPVELKWHLLVSLENFLSIHQGCDVDPINARCHSFISFYFLSLSLSLFLLWLPAFPVADSSRYIVSDISINSIWREGAIEWKRAANPIRMQTVMD